MNFFYLFFIIIIRYIDNKGFTENIKKKEKLEIPQVDTKSVTEAKEDVKVSPKPMMTPRTREAFVVVSSNSIPFIII